MSIRQTLDRIPPGERVVVERLEVGDDIRRRFLDLGLVENTPVECIGRSPGGDPSAYLIRGAVIAIRANDSRGIYVRRVTDEASK